MSAKVIHWDFLKNTRILRQDGGPGSTIRLDMLLNLIGHANAHNRCWPSISTISKETGISDRNGIIAALDWLEEHDAIFRVPNDLRYSEEHRLNSKKTVYEITGIVVVEGHIFPYLLMNEDEMAKAMSFVDDIRDGFVEVPDDDPGDENEERYGSHTDDGMVAIPNDGKVAIPEVIPSLSSTNKTITLVGGGVAPATSEGHRLASPSLFASKSKTLPGKEEDDSDTEDTSLANHDLGKLLLTTFGRKTFTREEAKAIRKMRTHKDEWGHEHEMGTLLELWDNAPGFSEFVKTRVAQYKAKEGKWDFKLVNVITHLGNVDKVAQGGGFQGWLQWRDKNPDVCRAVELKASDFLTPEQEEKGYTVKDINGVPTVCPPEDSEVRTEDLPFWMQ